MIIDDTSLLIHIPNRQWHFIVFVNISTVWSFKTITDILGKRNTSFHWFFKY